MKPWRCGRRYRVWFRFVKCLADLICMVSGTMGPSRLRRIFSLPLTGLSHEIFGPVLWPVWMHLGLNVNRLWFLNFNDDPLILDNYFMFWHVSGKHSQRFLRLATWACGSPIFIDFWLAVLRKCCLGCTFSRRFLECPRRNGNCVLSFRRRIGNASTQFYKNNLQQH